MRYLLLLLLFTNCNSPSGNGELSIRDSLERPDNSIDTTTTNSQIGKTTFRFTSGRTYFDQRKTDTIIIVNIGLPTQNRGMEVTGALFTSFGEDSFMVKTSKYYPDLRQLKIKINRFENIGDGIPIPYDTVFIPVQ